ncbi:hypothetical protein IE53DRAFT_314631 [Violaceomyces palustris]|uniref:Uncharacterized protein n=1 Tax=Violaceomyces palustris TaxID=1673888 RepID=A0ACD0NZ44_9BASI|nr:hypothetical protein IE53DRAFT_314631 [Violaceomyces palustris]
MTTSFGTNSGNSNSDGIAGPSSNSYNPHHGAQGSISSSFNYASPAESSSALPYPPSSYSLVNPAYSVLERGPNGFGAGGISPSGGSSQILIGSIVQRLVNRLPCNSGWRMSLLEGDELVRSSVANLVGLSRFQLPGVVRELLAALENLNKVSSAQQSSEDQMGLDVLQSQLFVLKVLVACMIHHWKCTSHNNDDGADPALPRSHPGSEAQTYPDQLPQGWKDPPPMDDTLAKHVLSVMTLYIRQTVGREEIAMGANSVGHDGGEGRSSKNDGGGFGGRSIPSDRSLREVERSQTASYSSNKGGRGRDENEGRDADWSSNERHAEVFTPSSLALANGSSLFILYPAFPPTRTPFEVRTTGGKRPKTDRLPHFNSDSWQSAMALGKENDGSENPSHLLTSIYRHASQVVFYLSASNWVVVYARFRNRLAYLSTTIEDAPNTAELRLLECSNLQRARLGSVIQELCTSFLHLKRSAQYTTALVLRRAVWSWIQYHPAEFLTLAMSNRRLEGGPDVLFDQVLSLAESTRKKLALWPMLTMLLILCPDIIGKAAVGEGRKGSGSLAKKVNFLELLRKNARNNNKLGDMAALCCVDICKAAAYTPRSETGLRLLVPDIEGELREKLFDPQRPLLNNAKQIEVALMIDFFVALFRLDPQRTMRDLVPVCMAETSPAAFKVALVKACVLLASEKHRLPWSPDVSLLYPQIGRLLRNTFKDIVYRLPRGEADPRSDRRALHRTAPLHKAGGVSTDESSGRYELLQAILQLWSYDIKAASFGLSFEHSVSLSSLMGGVPTHDHDKVIKAALQVDSILSLVYMLGCIFNTPAPFPRFRDGVMNVLVLFFESTSTDEHVSKFLRLGQEAVASCSPTIIQFIAEQLINQVGTDNQRHYMELLRKTLKRKGMWVGSAQKQGLDLRSLPFFPTEMERKAEMEIVDIALLLMICSCDTEVCSAAMQCCGLHARFRQESPSYFYDGLNEWTKFFSDLADPSFVQTGRIAQQKRIRALLRDITTPSAASWVAWKQAYQRWAALTQVVARPISEEAGDSAQEKAAQWHNYAGFLCAFGGACISAEGTSEISTGIESVHLPPRYLDKDTPGPLIERFLQEMVDLLVSDSLWVREKAKETLGVDLGPRLNDILFRQIHAVLSDFFDKATGYPRTADMYTIFVEQSILVASMVLSRMNEISEATSSVDIGSLMVLYVEYANSLGRNEQALRIKASMCQMCEALMRKKSFFAFTNELRVRNRLFQALTTWTSDTTEDTQLPDKLDRLQRELDVSCLKCISMFLDRLPLLLADDALILDDKIEWAKNRQFALYFNYFIKILNRTRSAEMATADRARLKAIDSRSQTGRSKDQVRDLGPLRESAILALSNLLASNIDSGLHNSLHLACQDDPRIRSAFMQIMTNVLNQGTAFDDLDGLTASTKQSRLVDLISDGGMQLALAICQVCRGWEDDAIDHILLSIFDSRGGIMKFLKAALAEEIHRTATEEMVFRSNSFRTHLLSVFAKTHGYEYLRSIMAPLITEMAAKPRGYSFEIDPSKLEPGESAHKNQARLEEMAQAFIDQICSSAHRVPAVLRELCRHIRNLMDVRFPSSRYQGVGGLMFLRFISPAVVTPQIIDINLTGPGKELRRGLLLISKILVTLASNNLFPSHKESFMTSLNDFLKSNVWKVTAFLDQVSDARTDPDRIYAADQPLGYGIHPYGYGIDQNDQQTLHRFLFNNVDKVGKDLLTRTGTSPLFDLGAVDEPQSVRKGILDGKKTYDQLCDILAEAGDPKAEEKPELTFGEGKFQDFLRRNGGRNVDEDTYKSVFYEGPPSKAGRPVIYFNIQNQKAETIDFEGLILHSLQVLETVSNRQFDLVFDLTACCPEHMTPHQWLVYFTSMIPKDVLANLCNVFVFNINTPAKLYIRSWFPMSHANEPAPRMDAFQSMLAFQGVTYCTSLAELEIFIERRNIALDPGTISIATSIPELRFDQITMVWYYRSLTPVSFRIGGDHLQITSLKAQEVVPGKSAFTNEVFHLADIDDVRSISIRGDDNTFFVTCRGGTISYLFNSRDRTEIVQALRQAKAKVSRFRTSKSIDRALRPSDVPGTLLNMAMLNITSEDYGLRLSAYNLLCALSTSFNFGASNARKRLLSAKGLALTANTMTFVAELSRDFAVAAPGVTLEFLLSFFDGFERATPNQKTMCLYYMSPWLSNLVMFTHTSRDQQAEYQKRIKEILSHLISITTKQSDMYAIMQRCVWSHISKLDDLIPIFLEVFSEAAMDSGLHTPRFEAVLDTMVSFASINLRGKLLSRLRRVIAKTAQNPTVSQLHENGAWKEIATLIRMNMMLSFTNRLEALLYLPELLHVILLLAGNGVDATRYSIHGTAINLMHSLCTEDHREVKKPEDGAKTAEGIVQLKALLARFSEPEFTKLFGLPPGPVSAFNASSEIVREIPDNASIEKLASAMYCITEMAAPSVDAANSWRARLTSLVTSTAFQYNPIIQSRAFVLLGCLAQGEIDDDLLYQILVSLRGSISEWANVGNDAPMISIVTCLSQVVKILPSRSRYLPQMFWLGISMIQYGHVPLFKAGVELLLATVSTIWSRNLALDSGRDLITFLLDARLEFREAACKLDDETGVDFEINFSFGMAALLVKGLRHPSTKEVTAELMRSMLRYCAVDGEGEPRSFDGKISTCQLGFFVGLLPTATRPEDFGQLLRLAGTDVGPCDQAIEARRRGEACLFQHLHALENKIALLVVTLVASLLQHAESDAERLLLYGFLAESAQEVPAIVSILYDSLAPLMREIFVNCQNGAILDAVHGIAQIAVSEPVFAAQAIETAKRGGPLEYLEESGYACLLECGSFTPLKDGRRLVLAKLCTQLLAGLIDVGTS